MSKALLIGPIEGSNEKNINDFEKAKTFLEQTGVEVISQIDLINDLKLQEAKPSVLKYFTYDLLHFSSVDKIAVMPNWLGDADCRLRVNAAKICKIPVIDAATGKPINIEVETIIKAN